MMPKQDNDGREANPYLDARREWNSEVERAFSQLHVWQLLGVAGLLIGLAGMAGITYIGSLSKFRPYVVEVDKLGEAVAVKPADVAVQVDQRVIRASLASFIASARLVTPDVDLGRKAVFTVYGMLQTKDPATAKLNEWFNGSKDRDPFERAKKVMVSTDIASVEPVSQSSWQVDWTETTRDRDGVLVGRPSHMRAMLEIYLEPPGGSAKESDIQRNPLGIFVRDLNWQEI
ncbi:MAG: conjugal transfer protein TrbF [Verrucomicrobia bacterium]|jgi:type IV secretion system protein TrbF|nr:conjugal transfer protein TrbF [Verrucomicrobiota bacterium]